MILGLSVPAFTLLHVIVSLAGIITGFIVLLGMLANKRLDGRRFFFSRPFSPARPDFFFTPPASARRMSSASYRSSFWL